MDLKPCGRRTHVSEAWPARKADNREPEGKSSLPGMVTGRRANKISSRVEINADGALDKIILQVA